MIQYNANYLCCFGGLTEKDDVSTVLSINAVTITDNYWIKPLDSDLVYADVIFDNDYFANLALTGNYDSFNRVANSKTSKTPELTNIGCFENFLISEKPDFTGFSLFLVTCVLFA